MRRTATPPRADGVIDPSLTYTFASLRSRGFGSAALREMQRRGMPARRCGKLKLVLGRDLITYLESLPVDQIGGAQ